MDTLNNADGFINGLKEGTTFTLLRTEDGNWNTVRVLLRVSREDVV